MRASDERLAVLLVDGDRRVRAALLKLFTAAEPHWDLTAVAEPVFPEDTTPDVALVDLSRSNARQGLRLIASLSAADATVIATSARDGLQAHALAAGATVFVPKDPYVDFVKVVRSAARGTANLRTTTTPATQPPRVRTASTQHIQEGVT